VVYYTDSVGFEMHALMRVGLNLLEYDLITAHQYVLVNAGSRWGFVFCSLYLVAIVYHLTSTKLN